MPKFKTTIGLEIHVQLATKSKMFCECDNNSESAEPNSNVCPVCLGMPGALPVANKQAIEWTIKTGLAMNCKINPLSKFDRKHYFYPDLPKGFQVSQYDQPFCIGGHLEIDGHKIRLNRIHLEEDAGKLIHKNGASYVDLNRAGTPLMEIVTEPDITSPAEAKKFLQELVLLVKYLGVSEASMEKGHLRCDANIDVKDENGKMSPIVELKNINSFKFIERALLIEAKRLEDDYQNWPEKKSKITRGYDSKKDITFEQRRKEEAADYRYFPEPDLPPVKTPNDAVETIKKSIGHTPATLKAHLNESEIPENIADKIVSNIDHATYLKDAEKLEKALALWVTEEVSREIANKKLTYEEYKKRVPITHLGDLLSFIKSGKISYNTAKNIFSKMVESGTTAAEIIKAEGLEQVSDEDSVGKIVDKIISENPAEAERYRTGEKKLLGFFVGLVMREMGGKANPQIINKLITERLESK
ncbi:MAG: Asp-tRNA(Asn)/Glu-tRNA(Gln) amidotransferase subunit GatB [Patescibacteria group bacterium]|jgi:aspartyl-tRNA(Asn)/glutamyl-tRNA(Gln) amidotransferase subunit B